MASPQPHEPVRDQRAASPPPQALLDQLADAVWSTDAELRITFAAGRLTRAMWAPSQPPVGLTIAEAFGEHDPTRPPFAQHLAALTGAPQLFHLDRGDQCLAIHVEPFRGADGSVIGCIANARDITTSERALERLDATERRLVSAQRLAHVGSIDWDIPKDAMSWSDEVYRIFAIDRVGRRSPETYASFIVCVSPKDRAEVEQVIFNACRTGEPYALKCHVGGPDGDTRTVHMRGEVELDASGVATRLVGSCMDITDLTEASEQLERTVSLLHATLDATADGILVVGQSGSVVEYNERLVSMWKLAPSALKPHRASVVFEEIRDQLQDPEGFDRDVRELIEHPADESLQTLRSKDERVFERYSRPQRVGDRIVGRVWSFRDVTERDRLLARAVFLGEATRLLASLDLEHALDAVARLAIPYMGDACAVDLFGEGPPRRLFAVSADPALVVATELPSSTMEGHGSIHSVGPRCYMAVPLVVKTRVVGAMTFVAREGRVYAEADVELADMVAERASLAYENAELYRGARDALSARDEFLGIVAHEIRNPLTSIHMAAGMLRAKLVGAADRERSLEIIEREDRRLGRFIDELLDIGRVRTGRLQFTFEDVDLVVVVRDVASELASELARAGSKLTLCADPSVIGRWDRERVHQIACHLLSNAIKFGRGKPIAIAVSASEARARLAVTDHGIGIASDQQERIFRPFERGVSTRHYGGLGLGLFIVRTLVEGMGGEVRVESNLGHGATFTVDLPAKATT